jgi:hypothetical protein
MTYGGVPVSVDDFEGLASAARVQDDPLLQY